MCCNLWSEWLCLPQKWRFSDCEAQGRCLATLRQQIQECQRWRFNWRLSGLRSGAIWHVSSTAAKTVRTEIERDIPFKLSHAWWKTRKRYGWIRLQCRRSLTFFVKELQSIFICLSTVSFHQTTRCMVFCVFSVQADSWQQIWGFQKYTCCSVRVTCAELFVKWKCNKIACAFCHMLWQTWSSWGLLLW